MKDKRPMTERFPYSPNHSYGERIERESLKDFNDRHNADTPGLSFRFYVWLTLGLCIVIATILYFAPALDHNPLFALLFLITIAIGLWWAIDRQAKKDMKP